MSIGSGRRLNFLRLPLCTDALRKSQSRLHVRRKRSNAFSLRSDAHVPFTRFSFACTIFTRFNRPAFRRSATHFLRLPLFPDTIRNNRKRLASDTASDATYVNAAAISTYFALAESSEHNPPSSSALSARPDASNSTGSVTS